MILFDLNLGEQLAGSVRTTPDYPLEYPKRKTSERLNAERQMMERLEGRWGKTAREREADFEFDALNDLVDDDLFD